MTSDASPPLPQADPASAPPLTPQAQEALRREAQRNAGLKRFQERRAKLDALPIADVFEALDADPNQDGDSGKWKLPQMGHNIIVKGGRWKNVSTDLHKGFGGVSLVRHAFNWDNELPGGDGWRKAMDWLVERFAARLDDPELLAQAQAATEGDEGPRDFSPPDRRDDLLPQVRDYLVTTRGLPPSLVDEMIAQGTVYASQQYGEKSKRSYGEVRCVFGAPSSAEIRGIGDEGFKGCCPGSDSDRSGFRVPHAAAVSEKILALQEAAIDALSYRALFPGRFTFSTNGSGRFVLQYGLITEALDNGFGARAALDADSAGDLASQRLFNAVFLRLLLSKKCGVPVDTVDAWLTAEASSPADGASAEDVPQGGAGLYSVPKKSPHELFFNTGWAESLPVHAHAPTAEDTKAWVATGEVSGPVVTVSVVRDLHPQLKRGQHVFPVSKAAFDYITQTLNFRRDRTPHGKDWNDALQRLGITYLRSYEQAARNKFKDGVPALPPDLEAFRGGVTVAPVAVSAPTVAAAAPAAVRPTTFRRPDDTAPVRPVSFSRR